MGKSHKKMGGKSYKNQSKDSQGGSYQSGKIHLGHPTSTSRLR